MASNRCLQADTALNQNCLIRSLGNEVGRRLDSFSGSVGMGEKIGALDGFSQKLLNSGQMPRGEHPTAQDCRTKCRQEEKEEITGKNTVVQEPRSR